MPAALLLHGAGGGGWEWNLWSAALRADGFVVVAPDLQPSAAGLAATTLDDYRLQALDAARTAGPAPVVIGASLGGLLALQVAAATECRAVVLVNPLPPAPEAARLPPVPAPPEIVPWRSAGRYASTCRALPDADAATRRYAFRRWRDESGQVLAAARAGVEVAPARCPLLLLASERDTDVPVEVSAALAARLGASLIRLAGDHLDPLLGTDATAIVKPVVGWIRRFL